MNEFKYDRTRLLVWPEWGSSGIWHPSAVEGKSHVQMVDHDTLALSPYLTKRFERWIAWYDDYLPEYPDKFPWDAFGNEGAELARLLAEFVGDSYHVECFKND